MDKLTMAHEMALKIAESGVSVDICVGLGWRYADSMQTEVDKHKEKGFPESLKSHEHNWENVTTMGDNVAKFVCTDCGAVKHDLLDKHL